MTPLERFRRGYVVDSSGCWRWKYAVDHKGYGMFKVDRRMYRAHRWSFASFRGPIPAGMMVCHACDVRECVNPDHLWIGTHQQNVDDMVAKGRSLVGEKSGRSKLLASQVESIRTDPRSSREIAADYGITPEYVANLKALKRWRHLGKTPPGLIGLNGQVAS